MAEWSPGMGASAAGVAAVAWSMQVVSPAGAGCGSGVEPAIAACCICICVAATASPDPLRIRAMQSSTRSSRRDDMDGYFTGALRTREIQRAIYNARVRKRAAAMEHQRGPTDADPAGG